MRDSAIIYRSFYESMDGLTKDQQADVWQAICEFSFNQKEVDLVGVSKSIFTLIRPQLAANHKRYENGKKPKVKQALSEPEAKPKQNRSKTEANKNKNINSNENEKVNEELPSGKPDSLTTEFLSVYNLFLEKTTGTTEQFSVAGRTALKKIILYITAQVEKKFAGQPPPENFNNEVVEGWRWVLSSYEKWDKFHRGQLKLEQINSNLLNIVNSIRNGSGQHTGNNRNSAQMAADAISISRARASDPADQPTSQTR